MKHIYGNEIELECKELLKCPFCGSSAVLKEFKEHTYVDVKKGQAPPENAVLVGTEAESGQYSIYQIETNRDPIYRAKCSNQNCIASHSRYFLMKDAAVVAWNTRNTKEMGI